MERLPLFFCLVVFPSITSAYIGPGMGLGAIGVILGILGAIALVLVAIIWYPLKRLYKKLRGRNRTANDEAESNAGDPNSTG